MKRRITFWVLDLLLLLFIAYVSIAVSVGIHAEKDTKTKSDAIMVLGARSYIDGAYNPCLTARVVHAAELYKKGFGHKLVVTGGNDTEDQVNEAATMKKIAEENGVKPGDILLEKAATSTYENFKLTQPILIKNKLHTVIIVTEPFHMPRAEMIADKQHYAYTVSPATQSPCWQPNKYFSKYFLKEPLAITAYKLQDKL
jgi:uncharacterized SAM-binding protein YcdF (DUF218 family)